MQRALRAIAVIGGWLTIPIGAVAGVAASDFFGLNVVAGGVPRVTVYGINAAVVLTVYLAAAVLTAAALQAWMLEPDPRPNLRLLGAGMGVAGLVLAIDELGRAFGLPLVAGAAALWIGGELVPHDAAASEPGDDLSQTPRAVFDIPRPNGTDAALAAPEDAGSGSQEPELAPAPGSTASPGPPGEGKPTAGATGESDAKPNQPSQPVLQPGTEDPRVCPWCSSELPATATECPNCHAALDTGAAGDAQIPGLTEVPSDLRRYAEKAGTKKRKQSLLTILFSDDAIPPIQNVPPPSDASALRPPTPELKAEMARLDAEIAAGGVLPDEPAGPAEPAGPTDVDTPP